VKGVGEVESRGTGKQNWKAEKIGTAPARTEIDYRDRRSACCFWSDLWRLGCRADGNGACCRFRLWGSLL